MRVSLVGGGGEEGSLPSRPTSPSPSLPHGEHWDVFEVDHGRVVYSSVIMV